MLCRKFELILTYNFQVMSEQIFRKPLITINKYYYIIINVPSISLALNCILFLSTNISLNDIRLRMELFKLDPIERCLTAAAGNGVKG